MDELGTGRHHLNRGDPDNHATMTMPAVTMAPVTLPPVPPPLTDDAVGTSSTWPVLTTVLCAAAVGGVLALNHSMNILVSVLAVGAVAVLLILVWAHRQDTRARTDRQTLRERAELLRGALAQTGNDCEIAQRAARELRAANDSLRNNNAALLAAWEGYGQQLTAILATMSVAPAADATDNGRDPVAVLLEQVRTAVHRQQWQPQSTDETRVDHTPFVNVLVDIGFRCQDFTHRAIDVIDALIQQVGDPTILADIFRLDHLTTRIRRMAENLILIGGPPPRQWRNPMSLQAILRQAKAEIEQYQRVDISHLGEGHVQGHVVVPLTHLLAELLENAASFSKPDSRINLSARQVTAGIAISVQDEGVGMPYPTLDQANELLRQGGTGIDQLLREGHLIGLWTAANLARSFQLDVELTRNIFGGITASVVVPHSLLADTPTPVADTPESPAAQPKPVTPPATVPDAPPIPWPAAPTTTTPDVPANGEDGLAPLPQRPSGGVSMFPGLRTAPAPAAPPADPAGHPTVMADFLTATQQERRDQPPADTARDDQYQPDARGAGDDQ